MEERFLILLKMSPLCLASWLQQISSSPGTMSSSGGNPRLCAVPACVSSPVLTQGQLAMAEQCVVKGRSGRSLPQSEIFFFFLLSFGQPWCQLWGKSTVRFKRVKSSELFLKCSVCGWRLKMPQCSAASCPRGVKQRAEVAFWLMAGKGAFSVNETICDRVVCGANFFWFTFPSFLEYTPDYVKWWCAVGCEL